MFEFFGEIFVEIIICGIGACIRYVFFFSAGRKKTFSLLLESDGYNAIVGILTIISTVFIIYSI